ncbi:hypothetical protein NC652_024163 [Populus alba x Populus x berolinensis]|nr:hypothetical protein NC652_024163 [Populus alba x Populus x berolinensis]
MTKPTFGIQAIAIQPEIAIPRINPDILIVPILTLTSLIGMVNNAGASGVVVDEERLRAMNIDPETWLSGRATNMVQQVIKTSYETAVECLNTNFYGVQRLTEALLPLLQLSPSGARIVNVSSLRGELWDPVLAEWLPCKKIDVYMPRISSMYIPSITTICVYGVRLLQTASKLKVRIRGDDLRNELGDSETLNEQKLDSILKRFLKDLKENTLEAGGWSLMLPAYSISKATLNAYTRVLAKRHPNMLINCVHPGYVNTDINWHTGPMPVEEGARGPVKCALLPDGGPTGCYFDQTEVASF